MPAQLLHVPIYAHKVDLHRFPVHLLEVLPARQLPWLSWSMAEDRLSLAQGISMPCCLSVHRVSSIDLRAVCPSITPEYRPAGLTGPACLSVYPPQVTAQIPSLNASSEESVYAALSSYANANGPQYTWVTNLQQAVAARLVIASLGGDVTKFSTGAADIAADATRSVSKRGCADTTGMEVQAGRGVGLADLPCDCRRGDALNEGAVPCCSHCMACGAAAAELERGRGRHATFDQRLMPCLLPDGTDRSPLLVDTVRCHMHRWDRQISLAR
jgi:hypothetical protein